MNKILSACLPCLVLLSASALTLLGTALPAAAQQAYYIHADHLNTPRLIENQSQQVVWRWDNDDPFGGNMANANPSGLGAFEFNLRFPGQYFDKETNQHYNYFRDYSPEIGRYVQSDPIGLEGGDNTYLYSRGNPLTYIDPDGLCPPMVDTGQFTGRTWSDKCFRKGRAERYQAQNRTQIVGTLVGQEGDCSCQETVTCIYDTTFFSWSRQTPCGGGAFSPWESLGPGPTRRLRVPLDCRTGKFFSEQYPVAN